MNEPGPEVGGRAEAFHPAPPALAKRVDKVEGRTGAKPVPVGGAAFEWKNEIVWKVHRHVTIISKIDGYELWHGPGTPARSDVTRRRD